MPNGKQASDARFRKASGHMSGPSTKRLTVLRSAKSKLRSAVRANPKIQARMAAKLKVRKAQSKTKPAKTGGDDALMSRSEHKAMAGLFAKKRKASRKAKYRKVGLDK